MTRVISSFSTKGGVGKTSFAKYFGITKTGEGKKVLLLDLCQNGDVASRLGYDRDAFEHYIHDWVTNKCSFEDVIQFDEETGIYFVPSNHHVEKIVEFADKELLGKEAILKNKIDGIKNNFDMVIIDNHPSETSLMMVLALVASNVVMIPTLLDASSIEATVRSVEIVEKLKEKGLQLEYFVQPMNVDLARGMKKQLEDVRDYFEQKSITHILPAIRYSTTVQTATLKGEEFSKKSSSYAQNVMNDYKNVSKELVTKGVN